MWLKQQALIDTWDQSFIDWFVVFEQGDMQYWWAKYLQPGFRHCYAVRWDGFNWIGYYPHLGHTDIDVLNFGKYDSILNVVANTDCSAILYLKVWRDSKRIRAPWPTVSTCVEQVKAILGVRKWFLFTAWQLFNYLEKQNGRIIQQT
ncbi:MAG: hypothetical protein ABGX60_00065 [Candidatus Thioglobus sp.]